MYLAHTYSYNDKYDLQTMHEHAMNVKMLAEKYSIPKLKSIMGFMGVLHDIGKYQDGFQAKIRGKKNKIQHAFCGAQAVDDYIDKDDYILRAIAQYCIAGHHTGLPDGGSCHDDERDKTLHAKLMRKAEPFDAYKFDLADLLKFDVSDDALCEFINKVSTGDDVNMLLNKIAFLTRYCFSCLTDADTIDSMHANPPDFYFDFEKALSLVNSKLDELSKIDNPMQSVRQQLQSQVFSKSDVDAEIFIMNMPTGTGKTLCSIKFALEYAIKHNKKRIIYVIPYNGIIDQTASIFNDIFTGMDIFRHQSTFSYNDVDDDDAEKYDLVRDNWDVSFIMTTAVQFFESVYDCKKRGLRKLHNMADSVIVFDEIHMLPARLVKPCICFVKFLAGYLNTTSLFLTATMPDYRKLINDWGMDISKTIDLVDKPAIVEKHCRHVHVKDITLEDILTNMNRHHASLAIFNTRDGARKAYDESNSNCKYVLSTYMTMHDRRRIITEIRDKLALIKNDHDGSIAVFSTSLIEAGIDIDMDFVMRELSGLDSIIQAAGRCNRENRLSNAEVCVFELSGGKYDKIAMQITQDLISRYDDILSDECIKEYYSRLYGHEWSIDRSSLTSAMQSDGMMQCDVDSDDINIPFASYSNEFRMISGGGLSIFVPYINEESSQMYDNLKLGTVPDKHARRIIEEYSCQLYKNQIDKLMQQHAVEFVNNSIWCLASPSYYDKNYGITFESQGYTMF